MVAEASTLDTPNFGTPTTLYSATESGKLCKQLLLLLWMKLFVFYTQPATQLPTEINNIVVPVVIASVSCFTVILSTLVLILMILIISRRRLGEYTNALAVIFIIHFLYITI